MEYISPCVVFGPLIKMRRNDEIGFYSASTNIKIYRRGVIVQESVVAGGH